MKNEKFNKFQMLKEMIESMEDTIENMASVIDQQKDLIEILCNSEKADKFSGFIKNMKDELNNLIEKKEVLSKRIDILKEVCNKGDQDENITNLIEDLLIGLGVFN